MGDDAYWRVPDGLDYRWEIELRHKRWGHIIQPFTSPSITHLNPLPPPAPLRPSTLGPQLRDTIRPVCYEGRVEWSRQGHDNKLADGCWKNKGHHRLDIGAIAISQNLSAVRRECGSLWEVRETALTLTLWPPWYRDCTMPHCGHKGWLSAKTSQSCRRTVRKMKCLWDVFY